MNDKTACSLPAPESEGAKLAGPQPERYVSVKKIIEVCERIMRESNDLTADSEDYRIGQWSGAEKAKWALECEASIRPFAPSETGAPAGETPRTDAVAQISLGSTLCTPGTDIVSGDFARQLERENAALKRDAERYRWLRAQWTYAEWGRCLGKPIARPQDVDAAIDATREKA